MPAGGQLWDLGQPPGSPGDRRQCSPHPGGSSQRGLDRQREPRKREVTDNGRDSHSREDRAAALKGGGGEEARKRRRAPNAASQDPGRQIEAGDNRLQRLTQSRVEQWPDCTPTLPASKVQYHYMSVCACMYSFMKRK